MAASIMQSVGHAGGEGTPHVDAQLLDGRLREIATKLADGGDGGLFEKVEAFLLGILMGNQTLRVGVFRLVEAYPALRLPETTLDRIVEELGGPSSPRIVRWLVHVATVIPGGAWMARGISSFGISATAKRFIAGRDADDALAVLRELWKNGTGVIVDALGEKTVTSGESDHYAARVLDLVERLGTEAQSWPSQPRQEHDHHGAVPRVAVAIKPTALSPKFAPVTRQRGINDVATRLGPILASAAEHGVFVWFDMEQHAVKDMTHELFRSLVDTVPSAPVGIVLQAYLRDSYDDLCSLIEWSEARVASGGTPIGIRLVKGAYWDHETVIARQNDWPVPVFQQKWASDSNYDRCAILMNERADVIRPAFASHNLRSLAHAIGHAELVGLPREAIEVEVLHGMAGTLPTALGAYGVRTRVYVPIGELVPGMSYLVRRLLENTSNESFLRQQDVGGQDLGALLDAPPALSSADPLPTDMAHLFAGSQTSQTSKAASEVDA
jgi:RHH-type proline utilization regulon transcriptional repressor/proline dehydrogenase/delta 1-pyrroline-5-carboxylate dehydrogenase